MAENNDMNSVILMGKLATVPMLLETAHGSSYIRYLVTVRTEQPRRRVDVIPVILWNPEDDPVLREAAAGSRVHVVGTVQRRFYSADQERKSTLEIHARSVVIDEMEESDDVAIKS